MAPSHRCRSNEDLVGVSFVKFDKATKILDGEIRYTIRQFKEDLRRELDCEMEKEELRETNFKFHLDVIYLSSIGYNARQTVKLLTTVIYPDASKDDTRDFVRDILALSASEDRALKLTNRFLAEEL